MATSTISTSSSTTLMLQQHEDTNSDDQQSVTNTIRLQPPTDDNTEERLSQIDELKYFLGTATNDWEPNRQVHSFPLPTGESLSCVFWNDLFHVTGTDIVRTLLYRFHLFGRPVTNLKKFEEGIFSDLRNLKPGMDASLEEPKSEFLEMLYKNNCIRTQKKQKVFFWFSVPHDRLFLDALERDLKREKMNLEPTSVAIAEPATSLSLDTTQELFDQLRKSMSLSAVAATHAMDDVVTGNNCDLPSLAVDDHDPPISASSSYSHNLQFDDWPASWTQQQQPQKTVVTTAAVVEKLGHRSTRSLSSIPSIIPSPVIQPVYDDQQQQQKSLSTGASPKSSHFELYPSKSSDESEKQKIFGAFSLFEGSPTYKQRQRRRTLSFTLDDDYHQGRLEMAASINPHNLLFQQQHEGGPEKVYTCPLPQCARLFKRLEHLKRHFRTHTLERPYSCTMCGKHFSRTDNLAQHKKTHNRTRSSSVLSRSHSSSKLANLSDGASSPVSRKRASSLRHSNTCSEIIDKLSVLTSNNNHAPAAALPPVVTTVVGVPMDYFSYQGGDMSRCASTTSPSGSIPQSEEDLIFPNSATMSYQQQPVLDEDICMTDNENNNAAAVTMYDEEDEQVPYGAYDPTPQATSSTTSSFMWAPVIGLSCSTASSLSSLLFNNDNNQQQQYYHRLSWYSSIDDKSVSPRSSSPTNSFYNNNDTTTTQIYSWQT